MVSVSCMNMLNTKEIDFNSNKEDIFNWFEEDQHLTQAVFCNVTAEPFLTDSHRYLGVYKEDELVAVGWFNMVTNTTLQGHFCVSSKYWGTDETQKIYDSMEEWVKTNTKAIKIMSMVPESCINVLKFHAEHGYEIEGVLIAGISRVDKLENLVIISKFLRR